MYRAGSENPADFLSRHPVTVQYEDHNIAEEYVNFVAHASVPNAMTMTEIQQETQKGVTPEH